MQKKAVVEVPTIAPSGQADSKRATENPADIAEECGHADAVNKDDTGRRDQKIDIFRQLLARRCDGRMTISVGF
jgi:hypothetical protein